jgi:hypothetical protein
VVVASSIVELWDATTLQVIIKAYMNTVYLFTIGYFLFFLEKLTPYIFNEGFRLNKGGNNFFKI